jgi:autotransporter family porin
VKKELKNYINLLKISFLLFGLGILFSFGISSASATNTSTIYVNTHGNDDWNGLNSTWTPNTLNGPKATINNATGTVKSGGIVYVAKGTYKESNIQIVSNMSIIGQSRQETIITGLKGSTFLVGKGVTLNLINMTIMDGNSVGQGGGGAIHNNGFLTVNSVTFSKNYADNTGGAIYNNGTLIVNDSYFLNNTVIQQGGAISNDGKMTVTNTDFTSNNAGGYGGAIYNNGVSNLINDNFQDNSAYSKVNDGSNGGAIYNTASLNVTNSIFNNNVARNNGGAIFNEKKGQLIIKNGAFTKNLSTDKGYGGALGNDGTATVTNTSFSLNTAIPGGAIANMGSLNVIKCSFKNNSATQYGGAILNAGTLNLNTANFENNTAIGNMGGAIANAGQLTITGHNSFTGNNAGTGGAIFNAAKLLINSNSIFSANSANIGGAIYSGVFQLENMNYIGNATIIGDTLKGNSAQYGGAIVNDGNMTVTNCTFINNTAEEGGAVMSGGNLLLSFNNFTSNSAVKSGGAILNGIKSPLKAPVPVKAKTMEKEEDSTLTETSSHELSKLIVEYCNFTNNHAIDGGAICNSANMTILDSNFAYNSAIGDSVTNGTGGAISNHGVARAVAAIAVAAAAKSQASSAETAFMEQQRTLPKSTISGSTFIHNNSNQGSAIYNSDALDVHFCRIIGNISTIAIYDDKDGVVNATLNWWGSNSNPSKYVYGNVTVNPWLVLMISANPTTIKNGKNTIVTTDLAHNSNGVYLDPVNGHVPDAIPVSFTGTLGTVTPTHSAILNGKTGSTYTSKLAGTAIITATVDNQSVSTNVTVNPASSLYMKITSSTQTLAVGEKFTVTYKLGNIGPDTATNVTINIPVPNGFSISNIKGDGSWKYNESNNTITWIVGNVPVGDPYLYVTGTTTKIGVYVFAASNSGTKLTINVQDPSNNSTRTTNSNKTIPMQNTGMPIAGLIFGVLSLMGGIITTRKR